MWPCLSRVTRSSPNGEVSGFSNTKPKEPKEGLSILGDGLNSEVDLEKDGQINTLQRWRYRESVLALGRSKITDASFDLLDVEQELRELVQEEITIRENQNDGSLTDKSAAEERLQTLNSKYQVLAQRWWLYRSNLELKAQVRGFELWRSHPQWYMHSELVKDCAGRQGCCARGCGCCLNRKVDASRSLGVGHCTLECGCCAKARNSEFSHSQKAYLKKLYKLDGGNENYRAIWIGRVSIWGLTGNSWANPFDMIKATPTIKTPPTYEQSEANEKTEKERGEKVWSLVFRLLKRAGMCLFRLGIEVSWWSWRSSTRNAIDLIERTNKRREKTGRAIEMWGKVATPELSQGLPQSQPNLRESCFCSDMGHCWKFDDAAMAIG